MLSLVSLLLVALATICWMAFAWLVRMPANRLPFIAAWSLGVIVGTAALVQGDGNSMALTAVILGTILLLLAASSAQRPPRDAIAVGDRIPVFTAPDENGAPVASDAYGGSPLLLKFFRGHW